MLLKFKIDNYKSFGDEACLSMIPAPKQKGHDYSILKQTINNKEIKCLSTSVIYGPNASGKTNIIGATDTFREIILRGHIKNVPENFSPNTAIYNLELIPNKKISNKPVNFFISFVENDIKFDYYLSMDIGNFLNVNYQRCILTETLHINDNMIFNRNNTSIDFGDVKNIKQYTSLPNIESSILEIAKNSLNDTELFLTNGFKVVISQQLVKILTNWVKDKFIVIYRANSLEIIANFVNPKSNTILIEKTLNKATKEFGVTSNNLGYVASNEDSETQSKLYSIFEDIDEKFTMINANVFESYGTIRFMNLFPLIIHAILTGGTLIIDEFDASIHPMALISIINIFHNDNLNKKSAQLIFNTHNPIFLNSNLFRRDEIKFVEREDNEFSTLYALSDFGTVGDNGVRKNDDYMKNYFISRYGAINDIDFTPIFEDLVKQEGDTHEIT